jgi:uncharacterized membrane protein
MAARLLLGALAIAYPLLVYAGLQRGIDARFLAALLLAAALWRWWPGLAKQVPLGAALFLLALAAALVLLKARVALRAYPVLVNLGLLGVFALSLRKGPSAIERLARLRHPDLDERGVRYTAAVTRVWCAFFALNAAAAAAVGLWGDDAQWALYNGLIAYGLMGALFGVEWLVRQRVLRAGHA